MIKTVKKLIQRVKDWNPSFPALLWHLLGAAASLIFIAVVSGWAQAGEDRGFVTVLMLGLTFFTGYLFVEAACDVICICRYRSYKKQYRGNPHPPTWDDYLREKQMINRSVYNWR